MLRRGLWPELHRYDPPLTGGHATLALNDVVPGSLQLVGRHVKHGAIVVAEDRREEIVIFDVSGNDRTCLRFDQDAAQAHPVTLPHVLFAIGEAVAVCIPARAPNDGEG